MPEVWIRTIGICTHFPGPPAAGATGPASWRTVLVNARDQKTINQHLKGLGVVPHIAKLQIAENQIVNVEGPPLTATAPGWRTLYLYGASLEIENRIASPLQDRTGTCIPDLSHFKHDVRPGPAVTAADPRLAACYLDTTCGTIVAYLLVNAVVAVFEIEAPDAPVLLIAPFQPHAEPTRITLRSPGLDEQGRSRPVLVNLMNHPIADEHPMNQYHFNLHWFLTNGFPPTPVNLGRRTLQCRHYPPPLDLPPGVHHHQDPEEPDDGIPPAEVHGCSNAIVPW